MGELAGLEVFVLAKEIESMLRGTYVKNVYSLGAGHAFRFGKPESPDVWLVVSQRAGVWVSLKVVERAETAPFTTSLRRELERARFQSARQLNRDRIFELAFGDGDGSRRMLVELMPPGNIVVTDGNGRILAALNEVRASSRRVLRGGLYVPPPQRRKDPASATKEDVAGALEKEATLGAALGRGFSLPRKYVAEAVARLSTTGETASSAVRGKEAEVAGVLTGLVREAETSPFPCLCTTPTGEEIFVVVPSAFPLKVKGASVSEICDEVLLGAATSEEPIPGEGDTRRKELEKTIAGLQAQEAALGAQSSRLRELAGRARMASSEAESRALMAEGGLSPVRGSPSPESVASALYDRAKESERKSEEVRKVIADLTRRRDSIRPEKPKRRAELRRTRQEWYEKFRWFITSDGKLAVGGRDAQSNSLIVRRHLETQDVVYHADLFGSPFFVLKGGMGQSKEVEIEMGQATVAFSSAWKTGLGAADAYWVGIDQVSTSAPSGEYLPRGGFLIKGKKNFVPRNIVELAVGIDAEGRVVSGPESAISKSADCYVVLRPQKEKGSDTAKRVLKDLLALRGKTPTAAPSVDDVLRMLPTGGGKIIRKRAAGPK